MNPAAIRIGCALAGWIGMGLAFLRRPRPPQEARQTIVRRDPRSLLALAVQGTGAGIIFSVRRPLQAAAAGGPAAEALLVAATAALSAGAVWLLWSAFKTLGAQWSVTARVREGHQLVTSGPYSIVRHPIYTGIGALMMATGLAVSRWPAFAIGAALYWIGTTLRIRREEGLLRQAFGAEYDAYAARVPAFVPGWKPRWP